MNLKQCSNSLPVSLQNNETRFFEMGLPESGFLLQMLSMMFMMLSILPFIMMFYLPTITSAQKLAVCGIMGFGLIGFFWTLKKQDKDKKQQNIDKNKSGIELVEVKKIE